MEANSIVRKYLHGLAQNVDDMQGLGQGDLKSIFFLKMRKQNGIVRIVITLSEGGKVIKNACPNREN
jgi:hypothetical protein